jgi:hypothetical protein
MQLAVDEWDELVKCSDIPLPPGPKKRCDIGSSHERNGL